MGLQSGPKVAQYRSQQNIDTFQSLIPIDHENLKPLRPKTKKIKFEPFRTILTVPGAPKGLTVVIRVFTQTISQHQWTKTDPEFSFLLLFLHITCQNDHKSMLLQKIDMKQGHVLSNFSQFLDFWPILEIAHSKIGHFL